MIKVILAKKDFYNIDDMKDIKFDDQRSESLKKEILYIIFYQV